MIGRPTATASPQPIAGPNEFDLLRGSAERYAGRGEQQDTQREHRHADRQPPAEPEQPTEGTEEVAEVDSADVPSTWAPDATAGRLEETTSPPTVAPSSIVAPTLDETRCRPVPAHETSPLNTTTEPFTCPSITAGPWKIDAVGLLLRADVDTSGDGDRTPSSLPLVCAAAGCTSGPKGRRAPRARGRRSETPCAGNDGSSHGCTSTRCSSTSSPKTGIRRNAWLPTNFYVLGSSLTSTIVSCNVRVSGVRCASRPVVGSARLPIDFRIRGAIRHPWAPPLMQVTGVASPSAPRPHAGVRVLAPRQRGPRSGPRRDRPSLWPRLSTIWGVVG